MVIQTNSKNPLPTYIDNRQADPRAQDEEEETFKQSQNSNGKSLDQLAETINRVAIITDNAKVFVDVLKEPFEVFARGSVAILTSLDNAQIVLSHSLGKSTATLASVRPYSKGDMSPIVKVQEVKAYSVQATIEFRWHWQCCSTIFPSLAKH